MWQWLVVVDLVDWSRVIDRGGTLDRNWSDDIVDDPRNVDSNRGIVDGCRNSSTILRGTCCRAFVVA